MRSGGAFILNGFLLIFKILDYLFEKFKIISYKGVAPLNVEEGCIPMAYPIVVNIFPHTFHWENFIVTNLFTNRFLATLLRRLNEKRLTVTYNEAR